jgi:acyl transferase domain-containing protein
MIDELTRLRAEVKMLREVIDSDDSLAKLRAICNAAIAERDEIHERKDKLVVGVRKIEQIVANLRAGVTWDGKQKEEDA